MKCLNKNAFTLIELLVVVLIIGILAAIAVVRYQLAIDKVKFIEIQNLVISLEKAYTSYVYNTGREPESFAQLDISFPENLKETLQKYGGWRFPCINDEENFCCINANDDGKIICGKMDLSFMHDIVMHDSNGNFIGKNNPRCITHNYQARYTRLCKAVGFGKRHYSGHIPTRLQSLDGDNFTVYRP